MVHLEKNGEKVVKVLIPTIDAVKNMVNIASTYGCDATLVSDRYTVDAKSIMGVFSLDVAKPLELHLSVPANKTDDRDSFIESIKEYIVLD